MITFKDFLIESRSAPLYHGTKLDFLPSIIKSGLEPRTLHSTSDQHSKMWVTNHKLSWGSNDSEELSYAKGVSLSRNMILAKSWFSNGVVLELDQRRLAQRFKIVPFQFFNFGRTRSTEKSSYTDPVSGEKGGYVRNEYEEFVLTKTPIPFSYVTRIYIPPSHGDIRIIKKIAEKYGSSFIRTY